MYMQISRQEDQSLVFDFFSKGLIFTFDKKTIDRNETKGKVLKTFDL